MARTAIGSPVNAKSAVSTYPRVERSAASRATFRVRLGYWPSTIDQRSGEPERADGGLPFISKPRTHAGIAGVLSARAAVATADLYPERSFRTGKDVTTKIGRAA